jgi:hemolysin III
MLREPVNVITHFVGAVLALLGLLWMVSLSLHDTTKLISVTVFGIAMILTFLASTLFHLHHGPWQRFFQRLDHAAIYGMIAGTYTPLSVHLLDGKLRWIVLGSVWGLALVGAFTKIFFFWQGHLSTLFYVAIGWSGILIAPRIFHVIEFGLALLILAGGITYLTGALVYSLRKPNLHPHFGHHELWHFFVLGGSTLHFIAVLFYVVGF